ncbi:MAG: glycosyltransferase family 2 protein [Phreatobacter sp.]|uniref:glycosyltransferase family 2 protein n=1 Tax=Phreatobacter sp. TaxID=1966341 RepID=UPI001A47D387|nr:glycosyltransferase family A protein [Phreatobacter sp.]MBL8571948.1 glycosyltransferase family 2 protein [Phreatobacter sp.]
MDKQVSIVIPVFQRQAVCEAAIASALAQTGVDFELIVVDDGSPDPFTLSEAMAAESRIRLIRQEWNAGAAAARNRGVHEAKAPWIAFLDSDDVWLSGKLAPQLALAQKAVRQNPLTCVMTGFKQVDMATGESKDRVPIESTDPADFASACWFAPGSTALVPREAFERIGFFDESLERLEDLDWFLRLALAGGSIRVLPRIASRVHIGRRPSPEKLDRTIGKLEAKWVVSDAPGKLMPVLRRNLAAYLAVEKASTRYSSGRYIDFCLALAKSLFLKPRLRVHLRDWWASPT